MQFRCHDTEPSKSFKTRNYTYKVRVSEEKDSSVLVAKTFLRASDDATLCSHDNKCQPFAQVLRSFSREGILKTEISTLMTRERTSLWETGDDQKFLRFSFLT